MKHFSRNKLRRNIIVIALLSVVVIASLTGCSKKVDLRGFSEVQFNGIDGKGTAKLSIDWSHFEKSVLGDETQDLSQFGKILELSDSIEYSLDKSKGLKNGDQVTLQIKYNQEIANKYKLKFSAKDKIYTVSGLSEAVLIDVFKDIDVNYSGISPYASAQILNKSSDAFVKSINFSMDHSRDMKNGDNIVVTANYSESMADQYLYVVESHEKVFTVSGIDEYTKEYQQIDTKTLDNLNAQSMDIIESKLASHYEVARALHPGKILIFYNINNLEIKTIEKLESYFLTLKDGLKPGWGQVSNKLFEIYQVEFTDDYEENGAIVYIPVLYAEFIQREGKTDVVVTSGRILTNTFNNYDNLMRDIITVNKSSYDYEIIKH